MMNFKTYYKDLPERRWGCASVVTFGAAFIGLTWWFASSFPGVGSP